jgi:hypothetical protein
MSAAAPSSPEPAMERLTSDARNQDAPAHETVPAGEGPRDRADPDELTVAGADGDTEPRLEQKRDGGP